MNIDAELIELLTEDIDFAETIDYWKKSFISPPLTLVTKAGHKITFSRMGSAVLVHKDAHPIIKFEEEETSPIIALEEEARPPEGSFGEWAKKYTEATNWAWANDVDYKTDEELFNLYEKARKEQL